MHESYHFHSEKWRFYMHESDDFHHSLWKIKWRFYAFWKFVTILTLLESDESMRFNPTHWSCLRSRQFTLFLRPLFDEGRIGSNDFYLFRGYAIYPPLGVFWKAWNGPFLPGFIAAGNHSPSGFACLGILALHLKARVSSPEGTRGFQRNTAFFEGLPALALALHPLLAFSGDSGIWAK